MPQPILKWIGGKRQLLPEIRTFVPKSFNRYFEPFVGGGALFFDLNQPDAYISDINAELINTYQVLAQVDLFLPLVTQLRQHAHANSRVYYLAIREQDRDPESFMQRSNVERAARFIYLNKTCFNGIYRVNSKGFNNVPYGDHVKLKIDEDGLLAAHQLLRQNTTIEQAEYAAVLDHAGKNDFVYFDPPYVPISATSSFTSYTRDGFSQADQEALVGVMRALRQRGAFVMVSNSWCPATQALYKDFFRHPILAARMVNATGSGRGKIAEMLATSYQINLPPALIRTSNEPDYVNDNVVFAVSV